MHRKVKKFFRRNFLYIVLALLMLSVAVGIGALTFGQLMKPKAPQEPDVPATPVISEPVQEETAQPQEEEQTPAKQEKRESDVTHRYGGLVWTYDSALLQEQSSTEGSTSALLAKDGENLPRMDFQKIEMELRLLMQKEVDRIAVGLVQEYYVNPPASDSITVTSSMDTRFYEATLIVPAHEDAPAMQAHVRILQDGTKAWYAISLVPEQTDVAVSEALSRAMQSLQLEQE